MSKFVALSPDDIAVVVLAVEDKVSEFRTLAAALPPGSDRARVEAHARQCAGVLARLRSLRSGRSAGRVH